MVNVVNAADLLIEHTKTLNKIDLIQRSTDIHYLLRQEYKHVAAPCPTQEGMSYLYIVLITNVILRAQELDRFEEDLFNKSANIAIHFS